MKEEEGLNPFARQNEIKVQEERVIHRVSFSRLMESIVDAFNLDRGLIFTLKRLFTEPGRLTRDYLFTGRFHYTPPVRMLIVSTTLVLILVAYSKSSATFMDGMGDGLDRSNREQVQKFFQDYYNIILWLFIPVSGFFTWLFNRRSPFNYAENLILQTYLAVIGNILFIVMALDRLIPGEWLVGLYLLASTVYYALGYKQFFEKKWGRAILEFIVIFVFSILIYGVVQGLLIGIIIAATQA